MNLLSYREVWPENDVFGAITAAPEDELLLLREIFMHNITTGKCWLLVNYVLLQSITKGHFGRILKLTRFDRSFN